MHVKEVDFPHRTHISMRKELYWSMYCRMPKQMKKNEWGGVPCKEMGNWNTANIYVSLNK